MEWAIVFLVVIGIIVVVQWKLNNFDDWSLDTGSLPILPKAVKKKTRKKTAKAKTPRKNIKKKTVKRKTKKKTTI
tara:strand:+ start:859 stop:1083 length:225 start_codon:yes stop_codon:yes gene_type:complete